MRATRIAPAAAFLFLVTVGAAFAADWTFDPNRAAHPVPSGQALWPDIVARPGGFVAVAWMDDHGGQYHVYYAQSTDAGVTWSVPEQVDTRVNGSYSKFPSLALTPSGIPVMAWEDNRGGVYNVWLSRRDPSHGGTPWTTNIKVNSAGGTSGDTDFLNASVTVLDETRFYVAWTDYREGVFYQVYSRATTDAGATWKPETRVSDELGYQPVAADACLIVDPSSTPGAERLLCVTDDWRGDVPGGRYPNVFAYSSSDGGAHWSTGVQVNDIEPWFQQTSSRGLVLLPDGTLVAGWLNSGTGPAQFRTSRSSDGGATWQPSVQVNPPGVSVGTWSSISGADGWVFAGYDASSLGSNADFRASSDGGATWTAPTAHMSDGGPNVSVGNTVIAAVSSTEVYGAWMDTRGGGAWSIYTAHGHRATTDVALVLDPSGALRVWPNPSRIGEAIHLARLGGGADEVDVVSADGRVVQRVTLSRGESSWNGADAAGRALPAGVYWARVAGSSIGARIVRTR